MNKPSTGNQDRIDLNDKAACESWVKKLNITHEKLHERSAGGEEHLRETGEKQRGNGRRNQ